MDIMDQFMTSKMVDRNLNGIEMEKSGNIEQAIELYLANVNEQTLTPHPYTRLAVIYTKQKEFEKVVEVMKAGLKQFRKYWPSNRRTIDDFSKRLKKAKQKH